MCWASGFRRDARCAAIKRAYRKLAKKCVDPDSNPGDKTAEQMFKDVIKSGLRRVLSDPKKKLYDQFGHAAFDETGLDRRRSRCRWFGGFSGFGNGAGGACTRSRILPFRRWNVS